jgi:hypothetical protein
MNYLGKIVGLAALGPRDGFPQIQQLIGPENRGEKEDI